MSVVTLVTPTTFLTWSLPMPVVASPGQTQGLSGILASSFGGTYWSDYWVTYTSANQLAAWDFSYWNPSNPSVATWLVNGGDIGGDFANQRYVSSATVGSTALRAGNDIGAFAYLTVPTNATFVDYIQYSIIAVEPSLMSPVAGL